MLEKDYNEAAWLAKLYGLDVIVVSTSPPIPERWALVDGNLLLCYSLLILDPHPPLEKIKKRWSVFDLNTIDDPKEPRSCERCGVGCRLSTCGILASNISMMVFQMVHIYLILSANLVTKRLTSD
jgi:hypothetical protein